MIAADNERILLVSGNGDVIEPDTPVLAIGSGATAAQAAAEALLAHTGMGAREVVEAAMAVAAGICIYTNANVTIEEL